MSSLRKPYSFLQSAKNHMGREALTQNRMRNRRMNFPIKLLTLTKEKHLFGGGNNKKKILFFSSLFLLEVSCPLFPHVELPVRSHFN